MACARFLVGHWQRSLTWKLELMVIRIAEGHMVVHKPILRRGTIRDKIPDVYQSTMSSCTTSNKLVLNMVKGHYLQFMCHPL